MVALQSLLLLLPLHLLLSLDCLLFAFLRRQHSPLPNLVPILGHRLIRCPGSLIAFFETVFIHQLLLKLELLEAMLPPHLSLLLFPALQYIFEWILHFHLLISDKSCTQVANQWSKDMALIFKKSCVETFFPS